MKKISFIIIVGISFLTHFSCSNDNESGSQMESKVEMASRSTVNLSSSEVQRAKKLYKSMVNTSSYIVFASSVDAINQKLPTTNLGFSNKTGWMNWIGGNISKTTFTSVAQFESMYDDSMNKLLVVSNSNSELFGYLNRANPGQVIDIIYTSVSTPTQVTPCIQNCMDTYSSAIDVAIQQHEIQLALADAISPFGSFTAWLSDRKYNKTAAQLALDYNACVGACP